MTHINEETIHKLEKLSNIKVDDVNKTISDLEGILSFMDNLSNFKEEVKVEKEDNKDIFREDEVKKDNVFSKLDKEKIEDNLFIVPKIIE